MNKRQLIEEIRTFNLTARAQFLAQFDEAALRQYLEHLQIAQKKRVKVTTWVRPAPKFRLVS